MGSPLQESIKDRGPPSTNFLVFDTDYINP